MNNTIKLKILKRSKNGNHTQAVSLTVLPVVNHDKYKVCQTSPTQLATTAESGGDTRVDGNRIESVSPVSANGLITTLYSQQSNDIHNEYIAYAAVAVLISIILLTSYYISSFVGGALFTNVMALKIAAATNHIIGF